jgi:hypothetical protein
MGFDVVVHPTLRGALKRLALAAPSVVVVESPLTDGWGEELIRQHRDAELPPVAFIVVSSREGGPSRSDGDNVVSLRRPCSIDDLTREIMKILGGDAHEARVRRHLHLVGADLPSRRTVADYLERRGFLVTVAESVPNTALPPGRHWDDVELGIFELNPPPHSAADGPTMGTASLRPILILDGQNDPSGLPIDPLHGAQKPSPPPNGLEELLELIRRRVEEAR